MGPPIRNSISTYRLRKDLLENYLKSQFTDEKKEYFDVHLSEDGKEFWIFYTPKELTRRQKNEIEENVRLKPSQEESEFL
ncbi:hypothetical protein QBC34DRAFT_437543 [Podospora aff. communis PSN243]|uniref:Uncharacterized protein n=1 Tax=Podospora aff. communis PSN243 TaxID=3040156 RepID=A0AAV9GQT6_9PEZI|nr:hypothetical protein QBC34DRAFT_437543 [Podospora aff. communis PSN243]